MRLTQVQMVILQWFRDDEVKAGDPKGKTKRLRATYMSLYNKGLIKPTNHVTFELTNLGRETILTIFPKKVV